MTDIRTRVRIAVRWEGQTLEAADDGALPGLQRISGLLRTVAAAEFPGRPLPRGGRAQRARTRCRPPRPCRSGGRSTPTGAARTPASTASPAARTPGSSSTPATTSTARSSSRSTSPTCCAGARPAVLGREHVALGTNTDPYQRAEGRYRLMPGVIRALADVRHAVLDPHQGHAAAPRPAAARRGRPRGPGRARRCRSASRTRSCRPRSSRARRRRGRGSSSSAPSRDGRAAVRGAPGAGAALADRRGGSARRGAAPRSPRPARPGSRVIPLHLRPGAREWFLAWLAREHPELVPRYRQLYARGAYVPAEYRDVAAGAGGARCWSGTGSPAPARPHRAMPASGVPVTRSRGSRPAACRGFGRPGRTIRCSRPCSEGRASVADDDLDVVAGLVDDQPGPLRARGSEPHRQRRPGDRQSPRSGTRRPSGGRTRAGCCSTSCTPWCGSDTVALTTAPRRRGAGGRACPAPAARGGRRRQAYHVIAARGGATPPTGRPAEASGPAERTNGAGRAGRQPAGAGHDGAQPGVLALLAPRRSPRRRPGRGR